jgi:hypothetical protein
MSRCERLRTERTFPGGNGLLPKGEGLLAILGVFGEENMGIGTIWADFERLPGQLHSSMDISLLEGPA